MFLETVSKIFEVSFGLYTRTSVPTALCRDTITLASRNPTHAATSEHLPISDERHLQL